MKSKYLQSNYTTIEQSKKLLELGVPADSADCYWFDKREIFFLQNKSYSDEAKDGELVRATDFTPCWSVGRLIEIFETCTSTKFKRVQLTDNLVYLTPLQDVLIQIEYNACGFYDNTKWDTNLLNGLLNEE